MSGRGLPEGTPILCRNCGGGMTLHADSSIVCNYCHARDMLPVDELGRVLEIKNRLAQAEQRTAQVKGFDATFAGVFEKPGSFVRVMGVYVAMGLLVAAMSAYQLYTTFLPNIDKLGDGIIVEVILGQLMAPLMMLGFGFSLGAALLTGRRHYRRHVRPLLIASRPSQPNAPFACRACGGALPPARGADVNCPYCRTLNLVPQELHGSHAAALFQEAEAAKQQLYGAHGAMMSISGKMRTTLILCGIATFVLAYGLPMVGMALAGKP
jgi:DNA-directed RNA polymerase subunit RPC12/RpoP